MDEKESKNTALRRARLDTFIPVMEVAEAFGLSYDEYITIEQDGQGKNYWAMVRWCMNYQNEPFPKIPDNDAGDMFVINLINSMCYECVKDLKNYLKEYKKAEPDYVKKTYWDKAGIEARWLLETPFLSALDIDPVVVVSKIYESEGLSYDQVC